MPYLNQASNVIQQYMSPYSKRGLPAGDILQTQFGQMSQDPSALMESIMKGYEPSKFYQMMQDKMGQAASNTAAAGGMRGSPQESNEQQEITQGLLSKDMQQYLSNILGIKNAGLSGEEGLYDTGYKAASGMSGDLSNILGTKAQLEFENEREKNERNQGILGSLIGLGSSFLGFPTGIDSSIGGDIYNRFFGA